MKAINTKNCITCKNKSKFDFKNIRYYCEQCTRFLCINCSQSQWVYEDVYSEERERPVCRCSDCLNEIRKSEDELSAAVKTMDFHHVDKILTKILSNHIDIDVKLRH